MSNLPIAYFVSSHGYGHATRASAVMAAFHEIYSQTRFELFTQTPRWLFAESLSQPFGYHELLTDIGLAQQTAMQEDLPETCRRLAEFIPFEVSYIDQLVNQLRQLRCRLVICDIAPLGIAVAQAAGLSSVLIENFTWDWIYEGYLSTEPCLAAHATYFHNLFQQASYHLQTEPVCNPHPTAMTVKPVSRKIRASAAETRQQLQIPPSAKLVLMTMGGIAWEQPFINQLADQSAFQVVVAGQSRTERRGNLLLLDRASGLYHPDLINAADVVIGKLGYSTLAEVYQTGVPYGYLVRQQFRESPPLVDFIKATMSGVQLSETEFNNGQWLERLPDLLALPRLQRDYENGADTIAKFMHSILS